MYNSMNEGRFEVRVLQGILCVVDWGAELVKYDM